MRTLGIDFGTKNIGIAVSDEEGKVAFPRATRARRGDVVPDILEVIKEEGVGSVVVGVPHNVPQAWRDDIAQFQKALESHGVKVSMQDESFSSHEAHHSAHQFGIKKITDSSAAAIILQRYLDRESSKT